MDWVKEASLNIFGSIRRIKTKKPSSSMTAFSQITYGVSDTHFILIYQATASDVGEMVHLGMQQAAKKTVYPSAWRYKNRYLFSCLHNYTNFLPGYTKRFL